MLDKYDTLDPGDQELMDAYVVELDPVLDGFSGVLVELYMLGDGASRLYAVRQSALASGNRLAVFSSSDEGLARAVFDGDIGEPVLNMTATRGSRSIG